MSDLVSPDEIEKIVGAKRDDWRHIGRAVSAERKMYILHSRRCLHKREDLRDCSFSEAMDLGLDLMFWQTNEDKAVGLMISATDGRLLPDVAVQIVPLA